METGIPNVVINKPLSIAALSVPKKDQGADTVQPVTLQQFLMMLSFLGVALLLSTCLFLGELMSFSMKRKSLTTSMQVATTQQANNWYNFKQ